MPKRTWSQQRVYRPFIYGALGVALTLGFTTGAGMLLLPVFGPVDGITWRTNTQAHGVAQALGWAGLFVMGIAYHVVPRFRNTSMPVVWPQYLSLVLVIAGVALRFTGQSFHTSTSTSDVLLGLSAGLLIAGTGIFVGLTGWTLRRGSAEHSQTEWWIWTGLVWLIASTAIHAWVVADMIGGDAPVASSRLGQAFAHASLVGFVTCFVIGVSLRTLTGFMSLRPQRTRYTWVSFAALNAGVAVYVFSVLARLDDLWLLWAAILELIGILTFVWALRLMEPRAKSRPNIARTYLRHGWFVKAAYGWLTVWAVLQTIEKGGAVFDSDVLRSVVASPLLHVLGVGFVTMVILGMAGRMLPMFQGAFLPHHRFMDAAFVLLNLSVTLRFVFGIVHTDASSAFLGASGFFGVAALVLFAWVVWGVFRPSAQEKYKAEMQQMAFAPLELVKQPRRPHDSQT